jgi:hypothetical protein
MVHLSPVMLVALTVALLVPDTERNLRVGMLRFWDHLRGAIVANAACDSRFSLGGATARSVLALAGAS